MASLFASARVMLDDDNKQMYYRMALAEQSISRAVSDVGGPSERLSRTAVRLLVGV